MIITTMIANVLDFNHSYCYSPWSYSSVCKGGLNGLNKGQDFDLLSLIVSCLVYIFYYIFYLISFWNCLSMIRLSVRVNCGSLLLNLLTSCCLNSNYSYDFIDARS